MKKIIHTTFGLLLVVAFTLFLTSCSKEEGAKAPTVTFKSGSGYTSESGTAYKNEILKVGIIAEKNEEDLRKLEITVQLAHANSSQTKKTITIDEDDASHFETDYEIKTGSESGTQTWKFIATDKDGSAGEAILYINVQ